MKRISKNARVRSVSDAGPIPGGFGTVNSVRKGVALICWDGSPSRRILMSGYFTGWPVPVADLERVADDVVTP